MDMLFYFKSIGSPSYKVSELFNLNRQDPNEPNFHDNTLTDPKQIKNKMRAYLFNQYKDSLTSSRLVIYSKYLTKEKTNWLFISRWNDEKIMGQLSRYHFDILYS